jgi:hypothetical protein
LPAAISFAMAFTVHQFGFEQIAERSSRAVELLERLLRDMKGRSGEVRQWTVDLGSILTEEQNSWYRQTLRLGVHL